MATCPSCASEVPDHSRFCLSCGAAIETPTSAPTETSLKSQPSPASHPTPDQARFIPGTILAKRYRIVGLLGRGGMGEVYRADDLKLGQPVALKFLPAAVQRDQARLNRFLNEVKVALKVTHPNVCRVYDIGEVEGQHYISMEYVDGEDLASLLRRIGHLPQDKAVQIGRQLCAGLAAAHEQGILHRDLKPANIMIDGRGRAKITDFGLASLAETIEGEEVQAGTPAYMAPEQLEGREVTVRSDLYSLGLVLYELFTGKRAFDAQTSAELRRLYTESPPTSPSSHVEGLDPAVERVILRCLATDPAERPGSALAVVATLPGGDPLAMALKAGDTPSPELVAEAGESGAWKPWLAWSCFGAFLVGLVLVVLASSKTQLSELVPLSKSPDVLVNDARQLLHRLDYDDPPTDHAWAFIRFTDSMNYLAEQRDLDEHFDLLQEGWPAVAFWYRQSPWLLMPASNDSSMVSFGDPSHTRPGMIRVAMGSAGNLLYLSVVPPDFEAVDAALPAPDWTPLLEAAELDREALRSAEPTWTPDVNTDLRVAWEGTYHPKIDLPVRVEAGAFRGRPVYFEVYFPWNTPREQPRTHSDSWLSVGQYILWWTFTPTLFLVAFLARRNIRFGRCDRKGATRIAVVLVVTFMSSWLLAGHHVPTIDEVNLLLKSLSSALLSAMVTWAAYLALEPYFRRLWPRQLVSWIRILDGRMRDSKVGQDLLLGGLIGLGMALFHHLYFLLPRWMDTPTLLAWGMNPPTYLPSQLPIALGGSRFAVGQVFALAAQAVFVGLLWAMVLTLFALILRRGWLAALAWLALFSSLGLLSAGPWSGTIAVALAFALAPLALLRFGLLSLVVAIFTSSLVSVIPMTTNPSPWYAGGVIFGFAVLVGLAAYGAWIASAGRSLFRY